VLDSDVFSHSDFCHAGDGPTMKVYQILQGLPEEAAAEIFQYLYANDKRAYRACLQVLATRRKLRPIVLERKTRVERHAWMHSELARKSNDDAATEVLQTWLLGAHQQLVCNFLESLGVEHDGRGVLDSLPSEPPRDRLVEVIGPLLENQSRFAVIAYLNLFCEMDIADWPTLKQILQEDSRLCLAPQRLAS
jgi:predicted transcriptional regulator